MNSSWTQDRVALLKRAWLNGESAAEIARALGGGVTRLAVLGKVNRLGLSAKVRREPEHPNLGASRPNPARPTPPPRRGPAIPTGPVILATPVPASTEGPVRRAVERLDGSCAWPIGDPRAANFRFCGEAGVEGRQYCSDHCRKAGISTAPKPMRIMGRVARPYRFGHVDRR